MPATILIGKTAQANWQEFSGPNGSGNPLPPGGPITFSSFNPAIATVDAVSGLITGVAAGSTAIVGTDDNNRLTASDIVVVVAVMTAQSATLTIVPN